MQNTAAYVVHDNPKSENIKIVIIPVENAPNAIHGLNLPYFVFVLSTISPMIGSFNASNIRFATINVVIIANTVKGKGVDFMENNVVWHYASADSELCEKAKASIIKGAQNV